MHPLAAASRSRLLETEPKLFLFETSYYAFCGRYCFESVASNMNTALSDIALNYSIRNRKREYRRYFFTESYELNLHVVSADVHVHCIHI